MKKNSNNELKCCSRIKIEIDSTRINKIDSHSNYLYIFKRNFMFQMQFCTFGINICRAKREKMKEIEASLCASPLPAITNSISDRLDMFYLLARPRTQQQRWNMLKAGFKIKRYEFCKLNSFIISFSCVCVI